MVLVASSSWAMAQSGEGVRHLRNAQQEVADVRYEAAASSLEEALASGDNGVAQLIEIYRLRGRVFGGLGRTDGAVDAFAHMLVLDPDATLGETLAPKITSLFEAARAKSYPRLAATAALEDGTVVVAVEADRLRMIAAVTVEWETSAGIEAARVEGSSRFALKVPEGAQGVRSVRLRDQYGNRLLELSPPALESAVAGRAAGSGTAETGAAVSSTDGVEGTVIDIPELGAGAEPAPTPVYARWWPYAGAAGVLAVSGAYFGWRSRSAEDDLDAFLDDPSSFDFGSDVLPVSSRADRDATRANVLLVSAAVVGAVSLTLYVRERVSEKPRGPSVTIAPMLTPTTGGVVLNASY